MERNGFKYKFRASRQYFDHLESSHEKCGLREGNLGGFRATIGFPESRFVVSRNGSYRLEGRTGVRY